MTKSLSPKRWANDLTVILNAVYKVDRFPVNVKQLSLDYSNQRYPDDPIVGVLGGVLHGFDGGLYRAKGGKKGWGIIYNEAIQSTGRINFTLAHEFGHYLIHRLDYPNGFECGDEEMASWDSEYRQLESQANDFAATLLMPLDDFRRQIDALSKPSIEDLGACSKRYEVSLIASILQWLQYTSRRSILVVSRDGFILWASSSKPALKSGLYYKTYNKTPIEISTSSLAAQQVNLSGHMHASGHDSGIWLNQPCEEHVLFSDQYDFTISLLHYDNATRHFELDEESVSDAFDKFSSFGQ